MARSFNPYKSITSTEPDLRQEMTNTLHGSFPEIAKGRLFLFRKMRKDANGNFIPCACVDPLTHEPDVDTHCSFCFGERYVWDEILVTGYKQVIRSSVGLATKETLHGPGNSNIEYVSFFFEYDLDLDVRPKTVTPDRIIEIMTDDAGNPIRPYQRKKIYRIGTPIDFRSDNGKLEYWKLDCYEHQVKYLNGPLG